MLSRLPRKQRRRRYTTARAQRREIATIAPRNTEGGLPALRRIFVSAPQRAHRPGHPMARVSDYGGMRISCVQNREQEIQRCSMATNFLSVGPTNSDCGRIRRLFATCSNTCAVQPVTRETAKVGVNMSPGRPTAESTAAE